MSHRSILMPPPPAGTVPSRIAAGFVAAMLARRAQVLAEKQRLQKEADQAVLAQFAQQFEEDGLPRAIQPEPPISNRGGHAPHHGRMARPIR